MKSTTFKLFYLMVLIIFSTCISTTVFADDHDLGDNPDQPAQEGDPDQDEPEGSAFQNPTQAQRAENMAKAYAEKPDPELEAAMDKVKQAEGDLKQAEGDLKQAEEAEDEAAIEAAENAIKEAKDALSEANLEADEQMSKDTGVTAEDIGEMRQDGMGWGEIAHELGLHPSVMGMRHSKAYKNKEAWGEGPGASGKVSKNEIKEATERNFKSGLSKGHGVGADKGNKSDNGAKGKEKTAGKDKGAGNGNNGKGNSGGKKK